MSSYYGYKPYVPVAQRRADGRKALDQLRKKGVVIEPLDELSHRIKIATSFWGSAWCKHLESFSDYANRLPRGRTYVRNGSVLHLTITPGRIEALVQGSSLYAETVTITPLTKKKWKTIKNRCKGRIGSLIELLQGKISDEIMHMVTDPQDGLFPKPSEIKLDCSCPDGATMCKHIAAVMYGIGARLDKQPELLFKLRGVDHEDLITAAGGATLESVEGSSPGGRRRTIASGKLNNVFGVEFEDAGESKSKPARKKTRKTSAKKKTATKRAAKKKAPPKAKKAPVFKPTPTAIRKLRAKLGQSRSEFAGTLGVSTQTIVNWESKRGALKLRAANLAKLQALVSK